MAGFDEKEEQLKRNMQELRRRNMLTPEKMEELKKLSKATADELIEYIKAKEANEKK